MSRYLSIFSPICFGIALLCAMASAAMAESVVVDPVEGAKSALRKTRQPWYDVEKDAVRIVDDLEKTEAGERKDWKKPKRPEWSVDWSNWGWNWGNGTGGGGFWDFGVMSLVQAIGIILLFLVVGVLIFFLIRTFADFDNTQVDQQSAESDREVRTDKQRIENLPIQPTRKTGDFLQLAKSAYDAGNYADAIVYLFSYRLIQLDRAGHIRLTKGKTNRQYLYEITSGRELRGILGNTIVCFEDVFFGKHPLTKERFETTWHSNDQFAQIIEKSMA